MHAPRSFAVRERWVFDVQSFPAWPDAARDPEKDPDDPAVPVVEVEEETLNWTDVNEAMRGALRRIADAAARTPPLVEGSTFTLAVELHDETTAPVGHPQKWIPAQPNLQPPTPSAPAQGSSLGGATTTPIRSVQAGPLFFECWLEQGPAPDETPTTTAPSDNSNKATS
ncbi:hypothetical protein G7046_g9954 [Stylonectria norvegica]|nr:hypothetical protein G7046_g9954 [Stylonectria norvegica]